MEKRLGVTTVVLLGVVAFALSFASTAEAAPNPVSCGDTIGEDTTLTGADPVTQGVCNAGLKIKADLATLDCGGRALRGNGKTGISIAGDSNSVFRCELDGFRTGIQAKGLGGHTLEENFIHDGRTGIKLSKEFNSVSNNLVQDNSRTGIVVRGRENDVSGFDRLSANVVSGSRVGIDARGREQTVGLNVTTNNKIGIKYRGREGDISENRAINNRIGFIISLREGFFTENLAESNTGTGIQGKVNRESDVSDNVAQLNGGNGMTINAGSPNLPNDFGGNVARTNGGNGIVVTGNGATDWGSNVGLFNAGPIQCQIGGRPCL